PSSAACTSAGTPASSMLRIADHESAPSWWYASDAQMPMSAKSSCWRNTPTSSDSKLITHCSWNACDGSRLPGLPRSRAYSLNSRSHVSSVYGNHSAFDSNTAIRNFGYRSRNPVSRTCDNQTCISWMNEKVCESVPDLVNSSPGDARYSG